MVMTQKQQSSEQAGQNDVSLDHSQASSKSNYQDNYKVQSEIQAPFSELVAQPYAARFLSTAFITEQTNHAYLFVGPLGAGKTEAAVLLAEALLCKGDNGGGSDSDSGSSSGGSGNSDDDRIRVRHRTHPDLHTIDPLGASGYLVEQIAEIIHDASLAPIRARRKVYLITRADLLRGNTANALLKTLEEPPLSASFVLLARTREAVLPTILSRCQVIAFRRVPETEAIQTVCARSGEQPPNARIALSVTGGSVYRAVEFIRSSERRAARLEVLAVLEQLDSADDLQLLEAVKRLLVVLKAPLDVVRLEQELQREKGKDYLAKGAQNRLEQQHKRELSTRERETVGEALDVARSWLRDVLLLKTGFATSDGNGTVPRRSNLADLEGSLVNYDHHYHIARVAVAVSEVQILAALNSVDAAQEQIQYNVAVQLALESMFFRVRAALAHV